MISPGLRQKFETLRQNIVASDATNTLATNKAEVKLIKDQRTEAKDRGFTVIQDEPESIGGTGQGPTPTDYFITSVGFCENVIFVRNASLAGLSLDSLETTVTGPGTEEDYSRSTTSPHTSRASPLRQKSQQGTLLSEWFRWRERLIEDARYTQRWPEPLRLRSSLS